MGFARNCFHAHGAGGASICPDYSEDDDDEQTIELAWVSDAGAFQIEAAGFGVTEETVGSMPSCAVQRITSMTSITL